MRVLVIGSGAREHSLCEKIRESSKLTKLYCLPGNPGTSLVAENVEISEKDISAICAFAVEKEIDLVVVGPEVPLSLGLADVLESAEVSVFGPLKAAALLEASKEYAKEVMRSAGVPTAKYTLVSTNEELMQSIERYHYPIVLKADGLAAGKGVSICYTEEEVEKESRRIFALNPSSPVLVEEFLEGVECSFIVAAYGTNCISLPTSHDYKRIFSGDKGANTGGMGAVSPSPRLTDEARKKAEEDIILPVLNELDRRGTPFKGFLYAGLMISPSGDLSVVEFNVRLGDPETQVILKMLNEDLLELVQELFKWPHKHSVRAAKLKNGSAVNTVLAAEGYPEHPKLGAEILGTNNIAGLHPYCSVLHAGTTQDNDKIVVSGGRVLSALGYGESLELARERSQKLARSIHFHGKQFRDDIGK